MRIRSDRRHRFDAPPDDLWAAMGRVDDFQDWWPWLRRFDAKFGHEWVLDTGLRQFRERAL